MKIAIYPGSFDPVTHGHLDILIRAAGLFDHVIVAVLHNPNKQPLFTVDERMQLIQSATSGLANVSVDSFMGLLMDYARLMGAHAVVRGVREISDFESELRMAQMNRHLSPDVVTVFIPTSNDYSYLSSSLIKEVASHGGDIGRFVPTAVEQALRSKFKHDCKEAP